MMAITEISKEIIANKELKDLRPMDGNKMLVLSLGTGTAKQEEKYNAIKASKWGMINWLYDNGRTPLLDVYADANSDIVDIHVSALFHSFDCKDNYLRIQVPIIFFFLHIYYNYN